LPQKAIPLALLSLTSVFNWPLNFDYSTNAQMRHPVPGRHYRRHVVHVPH
jgi:hypothetical protein